jgi:hypothetical protein
MQCKPACCPSSCRFPAEEPDEQSLQERTFNTHPETLSSAKKVLYAALAADTEREFVMACASAVSPWVARGLLFSLAETLDDAAVSIAASLTPEAVESFAETLGIGGPAIAAAIEKLKKAREPRGGCVGGGCFDATEGFVRSVTKDGTALVVPIVTRNEFSDRAVVRVGLRGADKSAVRLTKSNEGFFVEAPTSLRADAFVAPPSARDIARCVYSSALTPHIYQAGASSIPDVAPVVTWDGDTLVLTFNWAVESIPVPIPAASVDKRAARIALAKKLAAEVGFSVPGSEASDEAGKAAELDEYLKAADDVGVIHTLSSIIGGYLVAYPERTAAVEAELAPLG